MYEKVHVFSGSPLKLYSATGEQYTCSLWRIKAIALNLEYSERVSETPVGLQHARESEGRQKKVEKEVEKTDSWMHTP